MLLLKKDDSVVPTGKNQELIEEAKALNHVPRREAYKEMISGMGHKAGSSLSPRQHVGFL